MRSQFNIALIGEVDAGKSTTLGQILMKTGSVLETRIQEASRASKAANKDFEPAFLLDAFEYERDNEMTVDITSVSCKFDGLDIRFLDTPGHRELSNKFIGGASYADFALLILDSQEICKEEHFRHARMLRILGLKNFGVIVNKWDSEDESRFAEYEKQLSPFLTALDAQIHFILPVSAKTGQKFERLLSTLKTSLLSLQDPQDLLVLFKKNPSRNVYWGMIESGKFDINQKLFDSHGALNLEFIQWCGERIGEFSSSDRDPLNFATEKEEAIQTLKKFEASIVPLDENWTNFHQLRTKWAKVSAQIKSPLKNSIASLELSTDFSFFKPNPRSNFFTLEKDGRILAVGIPNL